MAGRTVDLTRSRRRRRSRGMGLETPTFDKNQQLVEDAKSLKSEVETFFNEAESALSTIEEQIQKAEAYAKSIADIFEKLSAFEQPLNEVVNNSNLPSSVQQGADDVLNELSQMLSSLEEEFNRAKTFIENNSGGGSSSQTSSQSNSVLPEGLQGRGLAQNGDGQTPTFQRNDQLLDQANALLDELNQFEELPSNPSGGRDLEEGTEGEFSLAGLGTIPTLALGGAGAFLLSQWLSDDS